MFQASSLKICQKTSTQVFSWDFYEDFRSTFSTELLRVSVFNCLFKRFILYSSWKLKEQTLFQRGFYLLRLRFFRNSILMLQQVL